MKTSIQFALFIAFLALVLPVSSIAQCRMMGGPMNFNAAPAVAPETLQKFNKETKALQEQLIDKQALLQKEWLKDDPDPAAIATIQKAIIDIQVEMQKVARKLGMKNWNACCPMFMGCGGGMGCGGRMGGMPGWGK